MKSSVVFKDCDYDIKYEALPIFLNFYSRLFHQLIKYRVSYHFWWECHG